MQTNIEESIKIYGKKIDDLLKEIIPPDKNDYLSEPIWHHLKTGGKRIRPAICLITCKELGEANSYITDIAQKTVKERLAEILIHLDGEFGHDNEGILMISLTREELSNIVGTATESIIRLLSEFKNTGLIKLNGRKIKILDKPGLKYIANI